MSSRQGDRAVLLFLVVFGLCLYLSPSVRAQGAPDIVWVGTNHVGEVNSVAFSLDGGLLASGSTDGTMRVWQTINGNPLKTITNGSSVSSVVFASTNELASWSADNTFRAWEFNTGTLVRTQQVTGAQNLVFARDGSQFATSHYDDQTVKVWRVTDGALQTTLSSQQPFPLALNFSSNNSMFASGRCLAEDFLIEFWRPGDGASLGTFRSGRVLLYCLRHAAFSPDASLLAVTTSGPDITTSGSEFTIWTVPDGYFSGQIDYPPIFSGAIVALAFDRGSRRIIAAYANTGIYFYSLPDGAVLRSYQQETANIRSLAVSPDGGLFAYGRTDGKVVVARTLLALTEVKATGGNIILKWSGGSGSYQIQQRTNLSAGAWQNLGGSTAATGFTNNASANTTFYRVQSLSN